MCTWHSEKSPLNSVSIACLLEHTNMMIRWLTSSNTKATPAKNTKGYSFVSSYLKAASVLGYLPRLDPDTRTKSAVPLLWFV